MTFDDLPEAVRCAVEQHTGPVAGFDRAAAGNHAGLAGTAHADGGRVFLKGVPLMPGQPWGGGEAWALALSSALSSDGATLVASSRERRIMRATPGRALLLTAAAIVAAAGCTPKTPNTAAGAASSSPSGRLLQVHDPGHVTGTVPASCHALPGPRPDPVCTPGAIDPAVTQADIATTICRSGYTATVRPPAPETDRLKRKMYAAYGIPAATTSELDHLVSLELGGSNDATNLWPEVGALPNAKDAVENSLHKAVCSGRVTLAAAQQAIASNWQTAESVLGLSG